jgi:hypothetical protein
MVTKDEADGGAVENDDLVDPVNIDLGAFTEDAERSCPPRVSARVMVDARELATEWLLT